MDTLRARAETASKMLMMELCIRLILKKMVKNLYAARIGKKNQNKQGILTIKGDKS